MSWLLVAVSGACGGGGGTDAGTIADGAASSLDARAGGDAPAGCSVGQVVWVDDGLPRCAIAAIASLGVGSTDSLDITATDINGVALTLLVGVTHPFAVPQSFDCSPPTGAKTVVIAYSQLGTVLGTPASCAIQVTQLGAVGGAHAQGTFSVVLNATGGGTRTLANGHFDVPRQQ